MIRFWWGNAVILAVGTLAPLASCSTRFLPKVVESGPLSVVERPIQTYVSPEIDSSGADYYSQIESMELKPLHQRISLALSQPTIKIDLRGSYQPLDVLNPFVVTPERSTAHIVIQSEIKNYRVRQPAGKAGNFHMFGSFGVPNRGDSSKVIASFRVTKVGESSKVIFNWETMGISSGEKVPRNALDQALGDCVMDFFARFLMSRRRVGIPLYPE